MESIMEFNFIDWLTRWMNVNSAGGDTKRGFPFQLITCPEWNLIHTTLKCRGRKFLLISPRRILLQRKNLTPSNNRRRVPRHFRFLSNLSKKMPGKNCIRMRMCGRKTFRTRKKLEGLVYVPGCAPYYYQSFSTSCSRIILLPVSFSASCEEEELPTKGRQRFGGIVIFVGKI